MRNDRFKWDDAKADYNRRVHRVTFDEACAVFADPLAYIEPYEEPEEDRDHIIGAGPTGLLFVVSTIRGSRIRIISARRATKREQDLYHGQASLR